MLSHLWQTYSQEGTSVTCFFKPSSAQQVEPRGQKLLKQSLVERIGKVIHPKYYKNSTFLVLGRLGCQGSIENLCNFANLSYFSWAKQIIISVHFRVSNKNKVRTSSMSMFRELGIYIFVQEEYFKGGRVTSTLHLRIEQRTSNCVWVPNRPSCFYMHCFLSEIFNYSFYVTFFNNIPVYEESLNKKSQDGFCFSYVILTGFFPTTKGSNFVDLMFYVNNSMI